MKVILLEDYEDLGLKFDLVNVKNGYARNFLIPQGIVRQATAGVLKELELKLTAAGKKKGRETKRLEELRGKLSEVSLTIGVKAGEEEKMYGAITNIDIAKALKGEGFEIDRHTIDLDEPIKELGVYHVSISLRSDIIAKVKVWVVKE
ncbi:MAG: 50S ribosomal protein L9 [Candidatus Kaelpia aquatica]|nr:50S ribosomal protein L9 [Candidatus Kaelpia aquatica]